MLSEKGFIIIESEPTRYDSQYMQSSLYGRIPSLHARRCSSPIIPDLRDRDRGLKARPRYEETFNGEDPVRCQHSSSSK